MDAFVGIEFPLKCPCMPNTTKVWRDLAAFKHHTKTTKKHTTWLELLSAKAIDWHSRCVDAEKLAEERAQINARLENELVHVRTRCAMLEQRLNMVRTQIMVSID